MLQLILVNLKNAKPSVSQQYPSPTGECWPLLMLLSKHLFHPTSGSTHQEGPIALLLIGKQQELMLKTFGKQDN